jgi:hypothetical protein
MQTSIIKPIIIAFKIVPIPGFCFNGNQKSRTHILTSMVIIPVEKSTLNAIPCARTDQGEAPAKETISNPSPRPNKARPSDKKKNVEIFGLRFSGFLELQDTLGIFLIDKNIY